MSKEVIDIIATISGIILVSTIYILLRYFTNLSGWLSWLMAGVVLCCLIVIYLQISISMWAKKREKREKSKIYHENYKKNSFC